MINHETVMFIDMMNKIASEYDEKSKFFFVDPQTANKWDKMLCGMPGNFCFDGTKIAGEDKYIKFYPLIHRWSKTGEPVYYPHTFIGVADDDKKEPDEPKYSIFTFPQEDFDWDTVIGYDKEGSWRSVEYIL